MNWSKNDIDDAFDFAVEVEDVFEEPRFVYRKNIDSVELKLVILPDRDIVSVAMNHGGVSNLLDISFKVLSPVRIGLSEDATIVYCHECIAVPGINSFKKPGVFDFYKYEIQRGNYISLYVSVYPVLGVRVFDPADLNRPFPL